MCYCTTLRNSCQIKKRAIQRRRQRQRHQNKNRDEGGGKRGRGLRLSMKFTLCFDVRLWDQQNTHTPYERKKMNVVSDWRVSTVLIAFCLLFLFFIFNFLTSTSSSASYQILSTPRLIPHSNSLLFKSVCSNLVWKKEREWEKNYWKEELRKHSDRRVSHSVKAIIRLPHKIFILTKRLAAINTNTLTILTEKKQTNLFYFNYTTPSQLVLLKKTNVQLFSSFLHDMKNNL